MSTHRKAKLPACNTMSKGIPKIKTCHPNFKATA